MTLEDTGALKSVAYLVGIAPQPTSPFTYDEIEELSRAVEIIKAGVISAPIDEPGWLTSGPARSAGGLPAFLRQLIRHPRVMANVVGSIVGSSFLAPRDLAVGLRSTLGACVLHESARPQLIHAQFAGPAAATAFVWSALARIPWTVRAHAYDIYTPYRWAGPVLNTADAVFAISEHGRAHLQAELGVPSEVVHVGIPVDAIPQRDSRPPGKPIRFISVGALVPKKGHDRAVAVAHGLARRGMAVALDIFGDGPLRPSLEQLAASGPAEVTLRGHLSPRDIRDAYQGYDALLMTSVRTMSGDMDGIPVVIMEAMAARLPVLSCLAGGIGELVVDGLTATSLPDETEGMETVIWRAFQDYSRLQRAAEHASKVVRRDFNVTASSQILLAAWTRIAESRRASPGAG